MDRDFFILTRGALLGLACTLIAELVRHHLEQKRAAVREAEEVREKRTQEIAGFLNVEGSQPAGPAWLRQVSAAQRPPLARLGLRRDEEFATAAYRADAHPTTSTPYPADCPTRRRPSSAARLLYRLAHRPGLPPPFRLPSSQRLPLWMLPFRAPSSRRLPRGGRYLLGPVQIIGRGPQCDIRVLDPAVSQVHALLRGEAGGYVLYDLGSTCGTRVDGCPVGPHGRVLHGGERLILGSTEFVFGATVSGFIPPPPPAPPASPPQS